MQKSISEPESIVIVVAGDGQHDPFDMAVFVDEILRGKPDYVVGERFSNKPRNFGMSAVNFVFGRLLNWFASFVTGIDVEDSTCGFTAIRLSALQRLELSLPARAGETHEMLLECAKKRFRVVFVPIKPIYGRPSRISKFTFFKNVMKVYLKAPFRKDP